MVPDFVSIVTASIPRNVQSCKLTEHKHLSSTYKVATNYKIHLPELLPVVVLAHLIFSRICIGSQLINALNSNLPH